MKNSQDSSSTHIKVESSSTLNRRYVHRPSSFTHYADQEKALAKSTAAQLQTEALKRRQALAEKMNRQNLASLRKSRTTQPRQGSSQHPQQLQTQTQQQQQQRQRAEAVLLAQAAKDRATDSALQSVATSEISSSAQNTQKAKKVKKLQNSKNKGRFLIALAASAACVIALGLVVKLNMPDLSVRVAAMQTGIEATYPSYIPNGFQLSGVSTAKDNTITMDFSGPDNKTFKLTEEKSSWDSNALLNNYVKETWDSDYAVVREQGITIYLSNSDATWVNGGLLYHLTSPSADTLTKKEIKNLVTSL